MNVGVRDRKHEENCHVIDLQHVKLNYLSLSFPTGDVGQDQVYT